MKYIYLLFTFIASFQSFSQATIGNTTLSTEWALLQTSEEVSFFVKKEECKIEGSAKPLVYTFMKVVNNSSATKKIQFNFGLQYFEGCSGCGENSEFRVAFELPANSTFEGDCNFGDNNLTRMIYNPNLSGGWKFETPIITNLSID